ncbi:MAG: DNA adenine methylase [Chloroflexota bacterium]|nr:DNA adenine methylase [Chloroflexota bacterium]
MERPVDALAGASDYHQPISPRPGARPITTAAVNGQTPADVEDALVRAGARPFVKWAGGKTQIVGDLLALAPTTIDTYYEPFVGGGALFFRLAADPDRRPRRAVLNDLNAELMATFRAVRDDVEPLIERLDDLQDAYLDLDDAGREARYYEVREEYRQLMAGGAADLDLATLLIFLNKTCFNGLYRVNMRGEFNVPYGRYARPRICDAEGLRAASDALANAELLSVDFEEACAGAGPDDFVYFDPPFYPLSSTSSFTAYTGSDFDHDDQLRLKWRVDAMREAGTPVLLSNSPHQWVLGLYEGSRYGIARIPARRMINSRGNGRGPIDELAVTSYEPPAAT